MCLRIRLPPVVIRSRRGAAYQLRARGNATVRGISQVLPCLRAGQRAQVQGSLPPGLGVPAADGAPRGREFFGSLTPRGAFQPGPRRRGNPGRSSYACGLAAAGHVLDEGAVPRIHYGCRIIRTMKARKTDPKIAQDLMPAAGRPLPRRTGDKERRHLGSHRSGISMKSGVCEIQITPPLPISTVLHRRAPDCRVGPPSSQPTLRCPSGRPWPTALTLLSPHPETANLLRLEEGYLSVSVSRVFSSVVRADAA